MTRPGRAAIETNTIFPIPLDQRHGRARDLFTLWFGSNIMMLTIVTGALAPTVFRLSLGQSVLAIVIGNLIGAVFMALHAAQGPQLGVPQMVQTRGQFGSVGAVAVIALAMFMYIGFVASNLVLGGQSLHLIAGGLNTDASIGLICIVSLVATIYGYDLIHSFTRLLSWTSGAALALCFLWIVFVHGVPADVLSRGRFTVAGFLGVVSAGALWQIAYAPYVSDYSRYLPPGVGARNAFWASYAGCVLGSVLPMILGALLIITAGGDDVVRALVRALGPAALLVIPVLTFGLAAANALNLYCGALSVIAVIQTFAPHWTITTRTRVVITILLGAAAVGIAVFAATNFMESYTNFILLLLYVMAPWTAINLVDFYLVRHGDYDVASFFMPDGGVYGRFRGPALACYALGIAVQIPFVSNGLYTGPIARMLGGADTSWIVGLAVVGPLYWLVSRRRAVLPSAASGAGVRPSTSSG